MTPKLIVISPAEITRDVEQRAGRSLSRTLALLAWWVMCIVTPVFGAVIGLVFGLVVGATSGVVMGIEEARADLKAWWDIVEARH